MCSPPSSKGLSLSTSLSPSQLYLPRGAGELALPPTHLGIEGVFEDLTQGFGVGLRFACLCGIKDGRLDPLGHCLPHQLGRELDSSGRKRTERKMGNARLGLWGENHDS